MLYLQHKKKNAFVTTQIRDIEECPSFTNFTIYLSYGVLFLVGYVKEFFYPPSTKETNREVECTRENSGLVIETPAESCTPHLEWNMFVPPGTVMLKSEPWFTQAYHYMLTGL